MFAQEWKILKITFQLIFFYFFNLQMRKISNCNQRFYREEPIPSCKKENCRQSSEVTVNGHHVCGDYILKNI